MTSALTTKGKGGDQFPYAHTAGGMTGLTDRKSPPQDRADAVFFRNTMGFFY